MTQGQLNERDKKHLSMRTIKTNYQCPVISVTQASAPGLEDEQIGLNPNSKAKTKVYIGILMRFTYCIKLSTQQL